jgi:circadian clock protein KaiC
MKRVPLGITKIDELLKGGVPINSCTLLSGEPGTGKSLIIQKIVNNCLRKGYSVIFVTTDRSPGGLIDEVKDYGMNYSKYVRSGQLKILDIYTGYVSKMDDKFSYADIRDLTGISIEINKLRKEFEGKSVIEVYDVISELFVWNTNKDLVVRFISTICSMGAGFSNALFFVMNEGAQNKVYINSIKSITDGIIDFGVTDDKRWFKISKMTSTSISTKKVYFSITDDGKIRIL